MIARKQFDDGRVAELWPLWGNRGIVFVFPDGGAKMTDVDFVFDNMAEAETWLNGWDGIKPRN